MWIRGMFLISFAALIDALQFMMGWVAFAIGVGLQSITPVGGAVGGAAIGAYACFSSSGGIIQGILDAAKCGLAGGVFGAAVSAFGVPFGTILGFAFDICISLTLGSGLIFLLMISGAFYPKYAWSGGVFELMPGFDVLPGWTLMVVLSLLKKQAEERKSGIVTTATKMVSTAGSVSLTNPVSAVRGAASIKNTASTMRSDRTPANDNTARSEGRTPLNLKSPRMNDITPGRPQRAANDNQPYVQKAA